MGSECAFRLDAAGWVVHGVDNNMRRSFFGEAGTTLPTLAWLRTQTKRFTHHAVDVRDNEKLGQLFDEHNFDLVIHAAGQPSHELAARRPFDDFGINALGTLTLLEHARRTASESPFVFISSNKVYGDAPNAIPLVEFPTRWDYADERAGIDETCSTDQSMHSLFGASKLAADVLVQEYGRYFGMPTVCFRSGCITGARHAAAELHGFLAYVAKAVRDGLPYTIYGYKGKQVRDNIHASDVFEAAMAFASDPRPASVYNLGGGRSNSLSVVEAIERFEDAVGRRLARTYSDEHRLGDHVCYMTDLSRFQADYPDWRLTWPLEAIIDELAGR